MSGQSEQVSVQLS